MKIKLNLKDELFLLAYELYLLRGIIFGSSLLGTLLPFLISQLIPYIIILLLILKFFVTKSMPNYSFKKYITLAVFILLSTIFSKDTEVLLTFLLAISAYDVKFEQIARRTAYILFIASSVVIITCRLGIIENRIFMRGPITRQSLGFIYVGVLDNYLLHFTLILFYLLRNKFNWIYLCLLAYLSYFIFSLTNVRGVFFGECFILLCIIITEKFDWFDFKRPIWKIMSSSIFTICLIFSIVLSLLYQRGYDFLIGLDYIFSNRIRMASEAVLNYGFTIFGQPITWVGMSAATFNGYNASQYNYVDNGYILTMVQYGLIVIIIVCIAYTNIYKLSSDKNDKAIFIWLTYIALSCLVYPNLFNYQNNCLLLYGLSNLIGSNQSGRIKRKRKRYIS